MAQPPPIPDSYWVVDGKFAAGEYAGAYSATMARRKIAQLLDAGIRSFIDLTEDGELAPYLDDLNKLAAERSLTVQYRRLPIRDLGVPSDEELRRILDTIDDCMAKDAPVYVHCWGGIGRTGTIIGCWLVRNGYTGQAALDRIAELRAGTPDARRRSPETDEQRALILSFTAGDAEPT